MDGNRNIPDSLYERDFAVRTAAQARIFRAGACQGLYFFGLHEQGRIDRYRSAIQKDCLCITEDVFG